MTVNKGHALTSLKHLFLPQPGYKVLTQADQIIRTVIIITKRASLPISFHTTRGRRNAVC